MPTLEYHRPKLYPKQEAAIFCPARYGVVEASTKAGKTVGCLAWLLEEALRGNRGQHAWWIAPIKEQAAIAYRRMKRGLPPNLIDKNETLRSIRLLPVDVTVWFKSADEPDSLYGEDVIAAVIDEATRCKEDAWFAVRSTLTATQGPIRIIGNVKGRKNWAYQMARRAEAGEPGMHYAKLTAYDAIEAGILPVAEIEDARRQLPEAVFRELYLAEPSDDSGNPFGLSAIRACIADLSEADPVAWGWDLAKSVDWTVGVALDAEGRVCRLLRWHGIAWEDTLRQILEASNGDPALIDSTGVGDPIVERLQRASCDVEGFKFTAQSKQQLMEGLAVAIQQRQVRYPAGVLVSELETFEYAYSRTGVHYTAPEGLHDDCVCALALAVAKWRARQAWTLKIWGGETDTATAQTPEEVVADEQRRIKEAEDELAATMAQHGGVYWPGD